jgi:bacteriocin-like protein
MALLLFSGPTPALAEDTSAFYALAGTDVREELTDTQLAQVQGGQIGTFTVQGQREFTLPSNGDIGDIGDINVACTPSCVVTIQRGGVTVTSTSSVASSMVSTFSSSGTSQINISSTISVGR